MFLVFWFSRFCVKPRNQYINKHITMSEADTVPGLDYFLNKFILLFCIQCFHCIQKNRQKFQEKCVFVHQGCSYIHLKQCLRLLSKQHSIRQKGREVIGKNNKIDPQVCCTLPMLWEDSTTEKNLEVTHPPELSDCSVQPTDACWLVQLCHHQGNSIVKGREAPSE